VDDVFLPGVTDLWGDPVPRSRGKRGRPAHVPTAENRRFVQIALACGHDDEAIAGALGITDRTLKRHYFHELAGKRSARLRLEMKSMALIIAQAEKENVSAMALLEKKIERMRQRDLMQGKAPREAKPPKLGKKEQALIDAHHAGKDSSWSSLLN